MKNKYAFVVFSPDNGHTRVFIMNKVVENYWISKDEAVNKAKELHCDFLIQGKDDISERIAEHNKITTPFLLKQKIITDSYVGDQGQLLWKSNDRCIPENTFRDAEMPMPLSQKECIEIQTKAIIKKYKKDQLNKTPEQREEEIAEMRAAFGSGETVINVITGEKIKL